MHDEQSVHHWVASVSEISYRNRHIFFTLSIPLLYGVTQIRWVPFQTAHPPRSLSYTPVLNISVSRFLSILTMTCYSGWALVSTVCFSTCKCQVSLLLNGRYSFFPVTLGLCTYLVNFFVVGCGAWSGHVQECWIIGNRSGRLECKFSLGCLCLPVVFKTKKDTYLLPIIC